MIARRRPVASVLALALAVVVLAAGCSSGDNRPTLASAGAESTSSDDAQESATVEVLDGEDITKPDPIDATDTDGVSDANDGESSTSQADTATEPPRFSIVAEAIEPAVTARAGPSAEEAAVAEFSNPTASGSPLVFRAVPGGATAGDWIEVQLPVQPNGTTGWVPREAVTLSDNPYRVEIDRAGYSLRVFHLNELWVETPIAVGNGETPTPVGEFYLLELLKPSDPTGPYGPFAFGLSGFSEVLTSFGGADEAIIGLHGTNDSSSLGTDVSHGCIRLANEVIEQFAEVLPLGTPVVIT